MRRCDCPNDLDEARLLAYLPRCSARNRLLVVLGMETGLRLSELTGPFGLTVGDVWRGGGPVAVLRMDRRRLKGGRGIGSRSKRVLSRNIPLNACAQDALVAALGGQPAQEPTAPLFQSRQGGRALTRRQATRVVGNICRAAGLDPLGVWSGGSLRQRYGRAVYALADRDINVARAALGHRWITTTQIYLGLEEEAAAAAIMALGARRNPSAPAAPVLLRAVG